MIHMVQWYDLIVTPFFIYLFYKIVLYVKTTYYADSPIGDYLIPAYIAKVIGSLAVSLIYDFYYEGGDTQMYYFGAKSLFNSFFDSPVYTYKIFTMTAGEYTEDIKEYVLATRYYFVHYELTIVKIAGVFSFFTLACYTSMSLCFAMYSLLGSWKLFDLLCKLYPDLTRELAISFFFLPSIIFWGSGLLKDSITFGSLCLMVYCSYRIFIDRKISFRILLFLIYAILSMLWIKPYIFLSSFPAVLLFVFLHYQAKFKVKFLKVIIFPILIVVFISISYIVANNLKEQLGKFSLENLTNTMQSFQGWHQAEAEMSGNSSGYTLGDMDYSTFGILKKFPLAVNVTFFQPYPWQVHKPLIALSCLESMFFLIITTYVIIRVGFRKSFAIIIDNPLLIFCMFFSIIFAFAVGMTSYNFGALVRYKIPCIPFFIFSIYFIRYKGLGIAGDKVVGNDFFTFKWVSKAKKAKATSRLTLSS